MTRLLLCITLVCVPLCTGAVTLEFSHAVQGSDLPDGWRPYATARGAPMADIRVVRDQGDRVLQISADDDAGAVVHPLHLPAQTLLSWRWKVDHSIANADLTRKDGDDYAARVYVFFDLPSDALSLGQRIKLSLARHVTGQELPTAALCYVWDNTHPVGTSAANAYYSGVRMIVLQSGNANAGQWQTQTRDLAADFRAAFGQPAPRVTGIALGVDTDNTHGQARARFGNIHLETHPAVRNPGKHKQ